MRKGSLKVNASTGAVKVEIKIENIETLEIFFSKDMKNELGKELFKLYPEEPNCIGIYVYHQYDKLK